MRQQLSDFAKGLEAYKRLGLSFENVSSSEAGSSSSSSNNIRVVFTLINAASPGRRYCFDVHVSPTDDSYAISACEPPVAALPELVRELNASNKFSHFVQQMRRAFKKLP